jgi:hypothetical protein
MQTVETSIRITTLDKRQGENEETATAHHGPTGRAVGLVAICRGKRDSALLARAGCLGHNPSDVESFQGHRSFSFPLAPSRPALDDSPRRLRLAAGAQARSAPRWREWRPKPKPPNSGLSSAATTPWRVTAAPHPAAARVGPCPGRARNVRRRGGKVWCEGSFAPPSDGSVRCHLASLSAEIRLRKSFA